MLICKRHVFLLNFLLFFTACGSSVDPNKETEAAFEDFVRAESDLSDSYNNSLLELRGLVLDSLEEPISNVQIEIQGQTTVTNVDGSFKLSGVRRQNSMLKYSHNSYYLETRPVHLQFELKKESFDFGAIHLKQKEDSNTRMFFGGDTSFGRRMLDSTDSTPFDQMPTNDLLAPIQVNDPLPGSLNALKYVKNIFQSPDFRVLNLESPVITDPINVHPTKDYSFFTLPASLDALNILGIDYVSLGNNHVYDYLEDGVEQTLKYINQYKIPNSGLGRNTEEAFVPYEVVVKKQKFSFISINTISGDKHEINYVAGDNKGGAADGRLYDKLSEKIEDAKLKHQVPVVQYHTGDEYTYEPSSFAHGNMRKAIDMGSGFVIAHHPHIAQGFEWYKGKFIAHSLGNFLLDQLRLETMLGVATELDIQGGEVQKATAIPLYLEDYKPRLIGGRLNSNLINRLSEKSINAKVYEESGRAVILPPGSSLVERTRTVEVTLSNLNSKNSEIIDLRKYLKPGEYLKSIDGDVTSKLGRDILEYGDFEDYDVDDDSFELARWDVTSEDRFACFSGAMRGAMGACLVRRYSNTSPTVLAFRNSIRVIGDALDKPNKDLSFVGYVKAQNAGHVEIYAKYTSSKDANPYGQETLFSSGTATDLDWTMVSTDLNMPADESDEKKMPSINARAMRVFVKHSSPKEGLGVVMTDEFAVVSWDPGFSSDEKNQRVLSGPNQIQFIKIIGASKSKIEIQVARAVGQK